MKPRSKAAAHAPEITDSAIRWLEISAGIASMIALLGLIALMAPSSFAQPPKGGLKSGTKPFANPFANPAGGGGPPGSGNNANFFDEDDEVSPDDFGGEGGDEAPAAPAPRRGSARAQAQAQAPSSAISAGGGSPSGVIAGNRIANINVDSETGEGSREVVTDFNFPDADILDIAKTLGRLTGKNFILDKDVKGRITIISNSPITVGDAWKAFLTSLDINGFALIPSGKYIRIARQRDARDKQLRTYTGDYSPDTDALVTRVFPLKYINSEEVARTFRSFMPANSRIIPYEQTNTVIVTDTGSNIAKLSKMLEILDVEGYDAGIELISVKFASAAELSKLVDQLLPGTGSSGGGPPGAPRFGSVGKFTGRRTKEGGIINTIIADERTNTLIVHANNKGAEQIRELVAKLDQRPPAVTGGGKVHVVYLQFAEAESTAATLNNLSQGAASRPMGGPGGPSTGTGVNPTSQALFEGNIKIAADKSTNSLVITGSPADFVTVQRVINRLDIPRDEVYVEVVIMEVSQNRQFKFSSNVVNPSSGLGAITSPDLANVLNPTGTGLLSQTGLILGFAAGNKFDLQVGNNKISVSSIQGLISAIQTHGNGNVLATPQIIALDNEEANFEAAEKLPVPTSSTSQGVVTNSVTKESVALSIKIKPQINKFSNFVKLKVVAKIEDVSKQNVPESLSSSSFGTISRTADTTVVVADSDTVVLGGLSRDKTNLAVTKIPLLGDIPILGWLFSSRTSSSDKTNLLIFMTPHIVRQYEKVRAILDRKLKERDDFIEANAGGNDPMRKQRDDMIRGLPDLSTINQKPPSAVALDEDEPAARVAPSGAYEPRSSGPRSSSGSINPASPAAPTSPVISVPDAGAPAPISVPGVPATGTSGSADAPPAPPAGG